MCQLVTNNLNYFVMFFYTYQLRIVHIKLSTQTPDDFYREIKKTNIIWLALFIEQILSLGISILNVYT